jgi:Domain of unknown function (DUF4265)
MMGIARKNEACGTGHGCSYADEDLKCNLNEKVGRGKCVCPGFFGFFGKMCLSRLLPVRVPGFFQKLTVEKTETMETRTQKLLFPLVVHADGWPPVGSESIPAEVHTSGNLSILNPPLFVKDLSVGDLISVEFDDQGAVSDWKHVQRSGNSTVWVLQGAASSLDELASYFLELKCNVERFSDIGLIAVDVPACVSEPALDHVIDKCRASGGHVAVPSFRFDEPTANAT